MLADPAMIFLMIQDHGKAVLRFGVLRTHLRSGPFSRGHELKGLWPDKIPRLDGPPQLQQVAYRAAETQIRVVSHAVFIGRHIARAVPAIRMRESARKREIVAISSGLYSGGIEDILLHIVRKALPGGPFHNGYQQLKAGDGPVPLLPRLIHPVFAGV